MSTDNKSQKSDICKSAQDILGSQVYAENVDFWNRAWSPVKTAYTQMPDLPYLTLMMSELASKAPTNVLDLGCGSGWLSILLARNGFDVTSRYSVPLLKVLVTWLQRLHRSNHTAAIAGVVRMASVDVVTD